MKQYLNGIFLKINYIIFNRFIDIIHQVVILIIIEEIEVSFRNKMYMDCKLEECFEILSKFFINFLFVSH